MVGAAWSLAVNTEVGARDLWGSLSKSLPCLSFLISKTKRRDWDDLQRAFHFESSVYTALVLGFCLVLLTLPLIKIQLTTSARKSKVKG